MVRAITSWAAAICSSTDAYDFIASRVARKSTFIYIFIRIKGSWVRNNVFRYIPWSLERLADENPIDVSNRNTNNNNNLDDERCMASQAYMPVQRMTTNSIEYFNNLFKYRMNESVCDICDHRIISRAQHTMAYLNLIMRV